MPHIIGFANQKGGVGKTSTVVHLGGALAGRGLRVLLLDWDEQAHATLTLLGHQDVVPNLETILKEEATLVDAIRATEYHREGALDIVPGSPGIETWAADDIQDKKPAQLAFRRLLRKQLTALGDRYDVVLMDCPPSGGFWLQTALAVADTAVVVAEAELLGADGVRRFFLTVDDIVREGLNPALTVSGVVVNKWNEKRKDPERYIAHYRAGLPMADLLVEPFIPYGARIPEAISYLRPVEFHMRWSTEAKVYRQLAEAMLARWGVVAPAEAEEDAPPAVSRASQPAQITRTTLAAAAAALEPA